MDCNYRVTLMFGGMFGYFVCRCYCGGLCYAVFSIFADVGAFVGLCVVCFGVLVGYLTDYGFVNLSRSRICCFVCVGCCLDIVHLFLVVPVLCLLGRVWFRLCLFCVVFGWLGLIYLGLLCLLLGLGAC